MTLCRCWVCRTLCRVLPSSSLPPPPPAAVPGLQSPGASPPAFPSRSPLARSPVLPCPVLSSPLLSCPVLSCPLMSSPFVSLWSAFVWPTSVQSPRSRMEMVRLVERLRGFSQRERERYRQTVGPREREFVCMWEGGMGRVRYCEDSR